MSLKEEFRASLRDCRSALDRMRASLLAFRNGDGESAPIPSPPRSVLRERLRGRSATRSVRFLFGGQGEEPDCGEVRDDECDGLAVEGGEGTATAGGEGTATAGDDATVTACDVGTATAGDEAARPVAMEFVRPMWVRDEAAGTPVVVVDSAAEVEVPALPNATRSEVSELLAKVRRFLAAEGKGDDSTRVEVGLDDRDGPAVRSFRTVPLNSTDSTVLAALEDARREVAEAAAARDELLLALRRARAAGVLPAQAEGRRRRCCFCVLL